MRQLSLLDQVIAEIDHGLLTAFGRPTATRQTPGAALGDPDFARSESQQIIGLMRVDHTGEICAQALYRGQAWVAKDPSTRLHLRQAASEEQDHLVWCESRLADFGARPSLLSPLWYAASFGIGAVAALKGDDWSYGFVAETEDQVEAHLSDHLERLPVKDKKSRAILKQMQKDEIAHAKSARKKGARTLPRAVKCFMKLQSKVMTNTAYFI